MISPAVRARLESVTERSTNQRIRRIEKLKTSKVDYENTSSDKWLPILEKKRKDNIA